MGKEDEDGGKEEGTIRVESGTAATVETKGLVGRK